ncbi:MAG TPA: ACT domain-containing protein [Gemmatimonadaceae bacterium]|nr:ACT domain-containing protein [Gemmatimonadaceae bacterium]
MTALTLAVLEGRFAVCRLAAGSEVPPWIAQADTFLTVSRTPTELSIVADESAVPAAMDAQRGYRALRVEGPLPLELVGVLAAIATPLAAARVPIFPIATYDTDYLLVPDAQLASAVSALLAAGHRVITRSEPVDGS